jgi:rod shape-determining protein MreC
MAISGRTGRSRFTLALLVLTSVTVVTLDFRGSGVIDSAREAAMDLLAPVQDAADNATSPLRDAWNGAFGYSELEGENEQLRQRIAELEGEAAQLEDKEREVREVYRVLDRTWVADVPGVVAQVVTPAPGNFDQTVEIDRGSDDGIRESMPVVTGAGLVGKVVRVSSDRALVRLASDPTFAAAAYLPRTGATGLVEGNGPGDDLALELVPTDVQIRPGEIVRTSGVAESQLPRDVPIGRVREVRSGPDDVVQDVVIDPFVDLDSLSYVQVLQWPPPVAGS